jgi:hypothetical protein
MNNPALLNQALNALLLYSNELLKAKTTGDVSKISSLDKLTQLIQSEEEFNQIRSILLDQVEELQKTLKSLESKSPATSEEIPEPKPTVIPKP